MTQPRSEIEEKFKWDLESVYSTEKDFKKDFKKIKDELTVLTDFEGDLDKADRLLEFLNKYSRTGRRLSMLSRFASMKSDEDTRDQEAQARKSRVQSLGTEMSKKLQFVDIEIQNIDNLEEKFEEEPELEEYRHYIEATKREADHTRSLEVEQALSGLSDVLDASNEAYSMLSNADLEFPEVEHDGEKVKISQANFTSLLQETDREFRREVYEKYYDTLTGFSNTIGSTLSKNVRRNVRLAEIREFQSARKRALFSNKVPTKVYDQLIKQVRENVDVVQRHANLKEKALGVEELGMHDLYMPVTEEDSPEISFEEAKKHVIDAVAPLGEDYQEKLAKAFDERWIDVYENTGKRSGAYSGGAYDTKPFILLNYQEDVSSMYTLAHELGHSMHSHYATNNQNYFNSNYSIFVAEVASTVNEELLTRHLLKNGDEKMRRHALNHSLENFRSTLFRQTMFAEFEKKIHETVESGEALTSQKATELYRELKNHFYANVDVDDRIEKEWMRIPHFYYNFYVFQYATGISAANALVDQILDEGPETYKEFLKKGGSDYPINLLRDAGVEMETGEPVDAAIKRYRKRLDQAEEEL